MLYFRNSAMREQTQRQADSCVSAYPKLAELWPSFDAGPFSKAHLTKLCRLTPTLTRRNFVSLVEPYLETLLPSGKTRRRLGKKAYVRDLMQLPPVEQVTQFDRYLTSIRAHYPMVELNIVVIEGDKARIDSEALERHCQSFDTHVNEEEDLHLLNQLEAFTAHFNRINQLLSARQKERIPLPTLPDACEGLAPVTKEGGQLEVNRYWVATKLH